MRFKLLTLSICVITLSGCVPFLGNNDIGPSNGGIVKSVNSGLDFEERNTIDEETSLAKANIIAFAIDPIDTNTIYVGTQSSGLYQSQNTGESWEKVNFPPEQIDAIAIDPRNSDIIYIAAPWKSQGRVYKTTDAGANWEEVYTEPVVGTRVTALKLLPQNPDVIYIGTSINSSRNSTIAKSFDAGKTWKNLRTNNETILAIDFDPENAEQMYVHTSQNDVLRSYDGGLQWESITDYERTEEQEGFNGTIHSFFVHERNPGELYIGTDTSLYKSENYGDSWEEVDIIGSAKGIPIRAISVNPLRSDQLTFASAKAIYVLVGEGRWRITDTKTNQAVSHIVYDRTNPEIVYIGYYNVKR